MYKAVCIDLDGTLLSTDKKVSKESVDVLKKLIDKGIEVIIATGRQYYMAVNFLEKLESDILICASNGAMNRFKDSGNLFKVHYLEKDTTENIIKTAKILNLNSYVYVDSFVENYNLIVENDIPKLSHFEDKIENKRLNGDSVRYFREVDFNNVDSILCVAYLDTKEKINSFYEKFKSSKNLVKNVYKVPDGRYVLEFQSYKTDKWNSIFEYISKKKIKPSELIAFGDEFNDYNMIKNAGLGFAMRNGIEKIKDIADKITTKTNDEDGVCFELKNIFSNILGE